MTPTSKACRQTANQLARAYRAAAFGGDDVSVRVTDPAYLINLLRRAARELDR